MLAALLAALLVGLAGCSWRGGEGGVPLARSAPRLPADERMPAAPRGEAAWLAAVDRAYAGVDGGRGADQWLRQRMARRAPGERLAVLMGIDDVMLRTHFGDSDRLVPGSVRFARQAHALGYSVFYVTGRSARTGLGAVEGTLLRAGVPENAFYGRPLDATSEETAKAECRRAIRAQGYTIAVTVAASEASFDGAAPPEQEIRLPDFAVGG